jgi:hypothetical protein
MADQSPQLEDVILAAMDTRLKDLYTAMPGIIQSYDPVTQSVQVQPCINRHSLNQDGSDDQRVRPVIHRVPVVFFGGKKGRITTPVSAGDSCLIVWSMASTVTWKSLGGIGSTPFFFDHGIGDGFAIIGPFDFGHLPTDAPANAMVLHSNLPIKLGSSSADEAVALKSDLDTFNDAVTNSIATLTASINPLAPAALLALATLQNALSLLSFPTGSTKVFTDA